MVNKLLSILNLELLNSFLSLWLFDLICFFIIVLVVVTVIAVISIDAIVDAIVSVVVAIIDRSRLVASLGVGPHS